MNNNSSYITRKDLNKANLWQKSGLQLSRLDIELTERCNNNCIHCYINQPETDERAIAAEMSTGQIKAILDEAASLGCMTVRFTGGEPLLRQDFQEIYLHTRRLGITVILFTNATLISYDLVSLFSRYPPGEPIEITLYGMTSGTYESLSRVKGSFDAAMNGVKLLVEQKIPVLLKAVRLRGREKDAEQFLEFAKKYSVGGKSGGISMDFTLRGRRDSLEKNKKIEQIRATAQEKLASAAQDSTAYIRSQKQFAQKFMKPGGPDLFTCGCGQGGCIDAYGKLQPCMLVRHPDLVYNLEKGTIADALSRFFPEVLSKKAANPEYLERCAKCFLKGFCNQCPAWSYMENGILDAPVQYLCDIAHEQARYLGLITREENAWQIKNWQDRINRFIREK